MKNRKFAKLRRTKPTARKIPSKNYANGECIPDSKPHPLLLAQINEGAPDLQQQVNDLTRLSRIRRTTQNDQQEEAMFEHGEFMDTDVEGMTPAQIDAMSYDEKIFHGVITAKPKAQSEELEDSLEPSVDEVGEKQSDEGANKEKDPE